MDDALPRQFVSPVADQVGMVGGMGRKPKGAVLPTPTEVESRQSVVEEVRRGLVWVGAGVHRARIGAMVGALDDAPVGPCAEANNILESMESSVWVLDADGAGVELVGEAMEHGEDGT